MSTAQPRGPPNIFHIVADDLGYDDLTNRRARTPHLHKLRQSGVDLTNLYSFKACGPSRASLLSGRYPFHMGIYSNADIDSHGVPSNFSFLPALLKRRGYATHAIGKWHVGYRTEAQTPTRRGFDSFFGFWRCCSDYWLHGDKDGTIDQTNGTAANGLVADRGHQGEYATQLYAREAARILKSHSPAAKPIYLYLAHQAVHGPYQAPEQFVRMYANVSGYDRRHYYAMITAMDEAMSTVERAAKHANLWENSLLLFMSDNGARLGDSTGSNQPFRGGKFTLWEGGTRILAFLSGPLLSTRRGTKWNGLAHASDLLPTLLSVAGVGDLGHTGPTPIDGLDLWDAILHDRDSPRI